MRNFVSANVIGYAISNTEKMNDELENGIIHQGKLHLLTPNDTWPGCGECSLEEFCMNLKDDICLCELLGSEGSHFTERGELVKIVKQNPILN